MDDKPTFNEGFPCPTCKSYDTVGLAADSDSMLGWCSCGVVWSDKNNEIKILTEKF